jgi:hypothetical protein
MHFYAQKSQNSNFSVLFHKMDTTVASGMVENARKSLTRPKSGQKITELAKKNNLKNLFLLPETLR